jgi:aminopeptidase-like protein
MQLLKQIEQNGPRDLGEQIHQFAADLYPICRSITGDGVRRTLTAIQTRIPLKIFEVPTGADVFDWTIPKEWNIRDAYIKNARGERIVDFQRCNLHVLNYSVPVHERMPLRKLRDHLFTIPDRPDWIPYRTSYYRENWGFCLSHNQLKALPDEEYEVCIESALTQGHLSYGECYFPGASDEEVLISCHICHPSLANDNLSGLAVSTYLAQFVAAEQRRYSYRFLFVPGTIGAIAWLRRNCEKVAVIRHGLVLSGIGNDSGFHYKKSRRGNVEIDRAMSVVLRDNGEPHKVLDFSPYGYDERQYCSPGFNLPVGCLMRSVWGTFPEYHTSADNLDFIKPQRLAESLRLCATLVDVLENNRRYRNLLPYCEPQLGKRGLYRSTGGQAIDSEIDALLWVLNLSDGEHSLLDISATSGQSFATICDAARRLQETGLLADICEEEEERDRDPEAVTSNPIDFTPRLSH